MYSFLLGKNGIFPVVHQAACTPFIPLVSLCFCCCQLHACRWYSVELCMLAARLDNACRLQQPLINGYCTLPRRPAAGRRSGSGGCQRWLSLTTAGRCA